MSRLCVGPRDEGLASFLEAAAAGRASGMASTVWPEQLLTPPGPQIGEALASRATVSRETGAAWHTDARCYRAIGPDHVPLGLRSQNLRDFFKASTKLSAPPMLGWPHCLL